MQKDIFELVKAQAGVRHMEAEEIITMVSALTKGLCEPTEEPEVTEEVPAVNPKRSIKNSHITCLVCGQRFKVLTKTHLATHGLDKKTYCEKFGLKKGTSLIAKDLANKRSEKMKSMKLWLRKEK